MKKLLSVLLVVAMLFGMATAAFAYTDVTAATQTGPVDKLASLGILKGYADGTFKPENAITRAEFAAVIVRALGLESAAKLINNPTKFSDVTADQAWAYGYINIASAKGIIKGDPNGKFRPNDKVSYAEVITMILRAGGWDAACSQMDWPAGFVMKAVEFGLTKDVTFDATASANRGAVAVMTYNALVMPMAKWNDTTKVYENDSVKLGAAFLKATEKTVIVTSVPNINSALKVNQVVTADGTFYVPAGVDPNALLGRSVNVIQVGTDTYAYAKDVTAAAKIVTATNDADFHAADTHIDATIGTTTAQYDLAAGAIVVRNNVAAALPLVDHAILANDTVTMFLNDAGAVRFVIAKAYTASQVLVTAKTTKGVNSAPADTFTAGGTTYNVAANTVYTLNGATATFADIAVGQVVYVQNNPALVVDMYNGKVTGKVTAVGLNANGSGFLTVNGTNYTIDSAAFNAADASNDVELDGTDYHAATDIGVFVNFDVTLKLNAAGKVRVVAGTTTALLGKIKSVDAANDKITVTIKGVDTEYAYICADPAAALDAGHYVTLTQRADGKVTSIVEFTLGAAFNVKAIDAATKQITLGNGATPEVLSIINYSTNAFGVRLGTWGDISLLKAGDSVKYATNASGAVNYFEVNPSAAGIVVGKIIGTTTVDSKTYLYVNVKGEVKVYKEATGMTGAPVVNDLMAVTLDSVGDAADVAALVYSENVTADGNNVMTVVAISGNLLTVSYDANGSAAGTTPAYRVIDITNAVIYSGTTLKTAADLPIGETFIYVEGTSANIATLIAIQ